MRCFKAKQKAKWEPYKLIPLHDVCSVTHIVWPQRLIVKSQSEKQSVQRKSSQSILTHEAFWYASSSSDMGLICWCRLHGSLNIRPAYWGSGHIYFSLSNWHVGIDGEQKASLQSLPIQSQSPGPLHAGAQHPISQNYRTKLKDTNPTSLHYLNGHADGNTNGVKGTRNWPP